ncbi:unnamed protein product, partial [Ectocarpus sp. 13 AM-2016]
TDVTASAETALSSPFRGPTTWTTRCGSSTQTGPSRRCAGTGSAAWRGFWPTWRGRRRPSTRSTRWRVRSSPWRERTGLSRWTWDRRSLAGPRCPALYPLTTMGLC